MTAAAPQDPVEAGLLEARQLLGQGRLEDSIAAYRAVLARAPAQVEALNAVGLWLLRSGNRAEAQRHLDEALRAEPRNPLTLHNIAQAKHAAGDATGAIAAYRDALAARPTLFVARLALARLIEEQGNADRALPQYFRAITDAQAEGRWRSRETTPPALQPAVEHAMRTINAGRRRLYDQVLEPQRQRYGAAALRRVEDCLRVYLGEQPGAPADTRQRPRFLWFPGLAATPYLDPARVPALAALEAATPAIRAELEQALAGGVRAASEPVFGDPALAQANLAGHRGAPAWTGFYFWRHGVRRDDNHRACPATSAALEALPLCRVRDHGPEVLFSVLAPGTHLLPHTGVTNTRVVGHLALIVPDDCALRVAGEEHRWAEGRSVLFDDTYLHEAWNRSDRVRVVLIFDLWHPDLAEPERAALTALIEAIGDFRAAADLPAMRDG
jgi:aspartate beta-hydroxylase